LPRGLVFPRNGQMWETLEDCEVRVLRYVMKPNGPVLWPNVPLRKGARVRILPLDHPRPLQVRFVPLDAVSVAPEAVHAELSLPMARTVPGLGETCYFNELFKLIEDMA
jgi:hypothetical protein